MGRRSLAVAAWALVGVLAAGLAFWVAKRQAQGGSQQVAPPARGLPHTPDYHALLVSADDPERLWLGTHAGLYESSDGGRSWRKGALAGHDAMNLVRDGERLWVAGHNVLFASDDGGVTWREPRPEGLPSLDLHGFAAQASRRGVLYAAAAGEGLYRSTDGGRSFGLASEDVGAGVYGLAVLPSGRILAADSARGLLASDDGAATWRALDVPAAGVAVSPGSPRRVIATGDGIHLSEDGGDKWQRVLAVPAGPVAWAPGTARIAYAIAGSGEEPELYRTDDGGATWAPVG